MTTYYIDDSFPASAQSLSRNPDKPAVFTPFVKNWLRPHELNPLCLSNKSAEIKIVKWEHIRMPIAPADVSQGLAGNCAFISALSALAERPELVTAMFVISPSLPPGAYVVRLCFDGIWTEVTVDDRLPCNEFGQLVFCNSKTNQWWGPIIEKAVAKLLGSYQALERNFGDFFTILTGFLVESIYMDSRSRGLKELVWQRMVSSYEAGFLMVAGTGRAMSFAESQVEAERDKYYRKGLAFCHAYTILKVYNANGTWLVRLRNTWGDFSWMGDWADSSRLWTPELKETLEAQNGPDGEFWMSFEDFWRYFGVVCICRIRTGWYETRIEGVLPRKMDQRQMSAISFTVKERTEVDFSLVIQNGRCLDVETLTEANSSNKTRMDLCIAIYKAETPNIVISDGAGPVLGKFLECTPRQIHFNVGMSTTINPGSYIVIPLGFSHWSQDENDSERKFVLALHSSKEVEAHDIANCPRFMLPDAIIRLVMAKARKNTRCGGNVVYYRLGGLGVSGYVIVVENKYKDKWVKVTCDAEKALKTVSTRPELKTVDFVPPLHRQVIGVFSQILPLTDEGKYRVPPIYTSEKVLDEHELDDLELDQLPFSNSELECLHTPRAI